MPKFLHRIAAVVLVSCLVANSTLASVFDHSVSPMRKPVDIFCHQALAPAPIAETPLVGKVPASVNRAAAQSADETAGKLSPAAPPAADGAWSESLTAREQWVLKQLVLGISNKEIAANGGIAEGTIRVHINNLAEKRGMGASERDADHKLRFRLAMDALTSGLFPDLARSASDSWDQLQEYLSKFTEGEGRVLKLALDGLTDKAIGFQLGISEGAVKRHKGTMRGKLPAGMTLDRAILVAAYQRHRVDPRIPQAIDALKQLLSDCKEILGSLAPPDLRDRLKKIDARKHAIDDQELREMMNDLRDRYIRINTLLGAGQWSVENQRLAAQELTGLQKQVEVMVLGLEKRPAGHPLPVTQVIPGIFILNAQAIYDWGIKVIKEIGATPPPAAEPIGPAVPKKSA